MIRLVKLTATAVWFPCLVYALASAIARPVRVKPEPLPSWRDGLVDGKIGLSGIYAPEPDDEPKWRDVSVSKVHPLEHIDKATIYTPQPGDVVFLHADRYITAEQAEQIKSVVRPAVGADVQIIVMEGLELGGVVRP